MAKPPITFSCALPPDDLLFGSMTAQQGISVLDEIELNLYSPKPDLAPEALLGKPALVTAAMHEGPQRHIGGIVMRFGMGAPQGRMHGYQAGLRPWLWFLTRTTDCRVFQDQTVPDIVATVFGDHGGIARFKFKLFRGYRPRVYCVQYRETDFNFVARLLEEEGIYWFFEHTAAGPELILVDDVGALSPMAGESTLPFYGVSGQVPPGVQHVSAWSFSREVQTGRVALTSYDFERPSSSLAVDSALPRAHSLADLEQFDFQGDYIQRGDGQQLAENRVDEVASRHERLSGASNAQGLCSGALFNLSRHPREDQNAQFVCLSTRTTAAVQAQESGETSGDWHCSFAAMPAGQIFRPPRRTPKPFVQGPQTAVVVGPAGEEIHTDKYSRVKLQFHWDRYGQKNEKSSCWVRVSSPWAGKSFGFVQVPRIGQEVVVDFLEGDPDQPLITGRVYNAEQMPPWELPANMTQSGVLSRSSKGGVYGNANALRFEDKKGEEQLWLHAEKDQLTEVEHDEDKWVGNDRRKTIDRDETNHVKRDRTETVDRNEKINVHGWRTEEVDLDETISIHQNRTETVDLNESITIHQNRSERVDLDEKISVGMNRSEDVGVNETIRIGANRTETVGANETVHIGSNRSVTIGGNKTETVAQAKAETIGLAKALTVGLGYQTTVGGAMNTSVGLAQMEQVGVYKSVNVGTSYTLEAGESITLKVGKSVLTMKADGTVTLNGADISIKGSGTISTQATGDIINKASTIHNN